MSKVIPPVRGQQITQEGRPTIRASEYMESVSKGLNTLASDVVNATASRTTTTNETIVCTGSDAKVITLNATPADKEYVTVIRSGSGAASLSGDINGGSSFVLATQNDSVTAMYTQAADEWSIIAAYIQ